MGKEEYLLKLSLLQEEANRLQEQLQLVNQQSLEMGTLKVSLNNLEKEKEILSSLGKGVYFKSEVKDNRLFVNIGSGVVVRKTPEEAGKIIDEQIKQLQDIGKNIISEIERINIQLQNLVIEARKEVKE